MQLLEAIDRRISIRSHKPDEDHPVNGFIQHGRQSKQAMRAANGMRAMLHTRP